MTSVPAALLCVLILGASPMLAGKCEALSGAKLAHTSITTAETKSAGDFTPPGGASIRSLPAFCRVAGVIRPSSDSEIRFEVWMPASDWNGKFQGVGNGGFAGIISYGQMGNALSHGYATASTDTGHADPVGTDAAWALHHSEKIADFGYRAIHETTLAAKTLIRSYYGEAPKRSYFNSCSNGGRQALMEVQRFPADYDGVIAGAPANNWTHLLAMAASDVKSLLAEPASYIPMAKLPAIEAAALAACDSNDQVKDGVIEDPLHCQFDPSILLCKGSESNQCLTVHQVSALKTIYEGLRDSKGKIVFPGYSPGGEAELGGWGPWITGTAPEKSLMFAFSTQFYKNMVYSNPEWQFRSFEADRDIQAADQKAKDLNATDPDLSKFRKRGGKLILYHGWSDAAIPALSTVNYYQSVTSKSGAKADSFVRLYMVPGMQHCGGGAGPNFFGQGGVGHGDRVHDVDAAMEAWVEQGIAPNEIIATKYKSAIDPTSGVVRTRPLCPFPQIAKWKGTGSTDDASNFTCVNVSQ